MNLNRLHFAELFRVDFMVVGVTFNEEWCPVDSKNYAPRSKVEKKVYDYKALKVADIKVGETLIVRVESNGSVIFKPVTVVKVDATPEIDGEASFKYKWIVGRQDEILQTYTENVEKDRKLKVAVEKLERALSRVSLKKQLEAAAAELDAETLAEIEDAFGQPLLLKKD